MTDQMSDLLKDNKQETDTYHDQENLLRIAVTSDRLSWLFLALFTVTGIFIALFLYWYIKSTFSVEQLVVYLLFAITPFVLGGFLWIASRALSEVIYLLMDIEDNTRKPKSHEA
ncbi:MAG: hypothetical protein C3F13_09050 [Anaerolineales bacterium]|nr:hypothetical protein [Anaerolineae bacterium]PWB53548.1 MAG: hypothetical protein C3F13_09050 [Anaerolineales bacterium]